MGLFWACLRALGRLALLGRKHKHLVIIYRVLSAGHTILLSRKNVAVCWRVNEGQLVGSKMYILRSVIDFGHDIQEKHYINTCRTHSTDGRASAVY
jgi:hypothetical protein